MPASSLQWLLISAGTPSTSCLDPPQRPQSPLLPRLQLQLLHLGFFNMITLSRPSNCSLCLELLPLLAHLFTHSTFTITHLCRHGIPESPDPDSKVLFIGLHFVWLLLSISQKVSSFHEAFSDPPTLKSNLQHTQNHISQHPTLPLQTTQNLASSPECELHEGRELMPALFQSHSTQHKSRHIGGAQYIWVELNWILDPRPL